MSSFQPFEDQDLGVIIPTVEVTDYSTYSTLEPREEESLEDTVSPPQYTFHSSLSPPSRASSLASRRRGSRSVTPTASASSASDREKKGSDSHRMSSSRSVRKSPSKGHSSSSKTKYKTDDWNDVMEPEERRRIQNRIAQRKFREKAREQKERAQRDAQNQEYASSSYRIPAPDDLVGDEGLSGLPWGSLNMRYAVAKGHESSSQPGSRRTSDHKPDEVQPPQFLSPHTGTFPPLGSYDSAESVGDDGGGYYDDQTYFYDYGTDPMQGL